LKKMLLLLVTVSMPTLTFARLTGLEYFEHPYQGVTPHREKILSSIKDAALSKIPQEFQFNSLLSSLTENNPEKAKSIIKSQMDVIILKRTCYFGQCDIYAIVGITYFETRVNHNGSWSTTRRWLLDLQVYEGRKEIFKFGEIRRFIELPLEFTPETFNLWAE